MMHPTGIIKIAQFDGAIEFLFRPAPVPMVTDVAVFEQKIGCSSAM